MKRVSAPIKRAMPEMSSTREPHASCFLFARIDEVLLVKAIIPLLNQSDKFQLDVCCRAWHSILRKPEAWKCLDLSPAQYGRRTRAGYVAHQAGPLSNNFFFVQASHPSLCHAAGTAPLYCRRVSILTPTPLFLLCRAVLQQRRFSQTMAVNLSNVNLGVRGQLELIQLLPSTLEFLNLEGCYCESHLNVSNQRERMIVTPVVQGIHSSLPAHYSVAP